MTPKVPRCGAWLNVIESGVSVQICCAPLGGKNAAAKPAPAHPIESPTNTYVITDNQARLSPANACVGAVCVHDEASSMMSPPSVVMRRGEHDATIGSVRATSKAAADFGRDP